MVQAVFHCYHFQIYVCKCRFMNYNASISSPRIISQLDDHSKKMVSLHVRGKWFSLGIESDHLNISEIILLTIQKPKIPKIHVRSLVSLGWQMVQSAHLRIYYPSHCFGLNPIWHKSVRKFFGLVEKGTLALQFPSPSLDCLALI